MMNYVLLILGLILYHKSAHANNVIDSIKSLKINNKVPDMLWETPLTIYSPSKGEQTIKLSQFKGKAILLDFLSTGCSSCISALPKIKQQIDRFSGDLVFFPITTQNLQNVKMFYERNKIVSAFGGPFIVNDSIFHEIFPHKYISHIVWIDQNGILRATTGTSLMTERTIKEFLKGRSLNWPVKTESTTFFDKALFGLNEESNVMPNNRKRFVNYSAITGYTEGVSSYTSLIDSATGIETVGYKNRSILDLYLNVLDRQYKLKSKQILLAVDAPGRFDFFRDYSDKITFAEWQQKNAICYEATFPLRIPKSVKRDYMRRDLNRLLGLNGRLEIRDTACLALVRIDDNIDLSYHGKEYFNSLLINSDLSKGRRLTGYPLDNLVAALDEEKFGYPLILDETNFEQNVNILLHIEDLRDLETLRKCLKKYGLDLIEVNRGIEFFVLQ